MLTVQQARTHGSATRRRGAALPGPCSGFVGQARRGATWGTGPASIQPPARASAQLVGPVIRGTAPGAARRRTGAARQHDVLYETRSVCAWSHRAACGAAHSNGKVECLGRSRGGICSKSGEHAHEPFCGPLGSTLGIIDPPPWDKAIYARRDQVENLFSRLKDWSRIALRHDKTRRRWMGLRPSGRHGH